MTYSKVPQEALLRMVTKKEVTIDFHNKDAVLCIV